MISGIVSLNGILGSIILESWYHKFDSIFNGFLYKFLLYAHKKKILFHRGKSLNKAMVLLLLLIFLNCHLNIPVYVGTPRGPLTTILETLISIITMHFINRYINKTYIFVNYLRYLLFRDNFLKTSIRYLIFHFLY